VWNKDDNWEPLWQDISDLADRVVSAPDDTQIRGHFLGTVVLEQVPHKTGSISTREIIEGGGGIVVFPSNRELSIRAHGILQRGEEIKSAGGYLRVLTAKARAGEFSLGPVLMALLRGKAAKAARERKATG
jgi:hypothetical protein